MSPSEVSKISGMNGTPLKPEEVCLRAVSLLKTIINTSWDINDNVEKENVSQNQGNNQLFQVQISLADKEYIKNNIFACMDMFNTSNKKIR